MPDDPKPYKGQNPKYPADEWTTDHDLSNPDLRGTDREDEDVLDPDAPAGAHDTADAALVNPYQCAPCPMCGDYASAAERCPDGNVFCPSWHAWKRSLKASLRWRISEHGRKQ